MLCGLSNKEKNCALCATGPALMNEENSLSRKIIANYFLVLYKPEENFWGGAIVNKFLFKRSYLSSFAGDQPPGGVHRARKEEWSLDGITAK